MLREFWEGVFKKFKPLKFLNKYTTSQLGLYLQPFSPWLFIISKLWISCVFFVFFPRICELKEDDISYSSRGFVNWRKTIFDTKHNVQAKCEKAGKEVVTILLSEIFPQKLSLMPEVGAWIQVRDWGFKFYNF